MSFTEGKIMNDMTITTCLPRPVRRIRPKPVPLLLRPEWRVDAPAPVVTTAPPVDPREGRARALARRQAAFQPVEVVCANVEFRARVEAIAARRAGARATAATMPLAAG